MLVELDLASEVCYINQTQASLQQPTHKLMYGHCQSV